MWLHGGPVWMLEANGKRIRLTPEEQLWTWDLLCSVGSVVTLDWNDATSGRRGRNVLPGWSLCKRCLICNTAWHTDEKPRSMKSFERKLDTRYQSSDFLHSLTPKDPFLFHSMKSVSLFLWELLTLATEQSVSKPSTFIHFPVFSGQNNLHAFTVCSYKRNWPFLFKTGMCHIFPLFQTQTLDVHLE